MKTTVKKQKQHYVDNQEFLAAIVDYRQNMYNAAIKEFPELAKMDQDEEFAFLKKWKSENKPRVGNYIGSCFLKIATHLSYKPNFSSFSIISKGATFSFESSVPLIAFIILFLRLS